MHILPAFMKGKINESSACFAWPDVDWIQHGMEQKKNWTGWGLHCTTSHDLVWVTHALILASVSSVNINQRVSWMPKFLLVLPRATSFFSFISYIFNNLMSYFCTNLKLGWVLFPYHFMFPPIKKIFLSPFGEPPRQSQMSI